MLRKDPLLHSSSHAISLALIGPFLMFSYDFVGDGNTRANARREGDGSGEQEFPPQVQEVPL